MLPLKLVPAAFCQVSTHWFFSSGIWISSLNHYLWGQLTVVYSAGKDCTKVVRCLLKSYPFLESSNIKVLQLYTGHMALWIVFLMRLIIQWQVKVSSSACRSNWQPRKSLCLNFSILIKRAHRGLWSHRGTAYCSNLNVFVHALFQAQMKALVVACLPAAYRGGAQSMDRRHGTQNSLVAMEVKPSVILSSPLLHLLVFWHESHTWMHGQREKKKKKKRQTHSQ